MFFFYDHITVVSENFIELICHSDLVCLLFEGGWVVGGGGGDTIHSLSLEVGKGINLEEGRTKSRRAGREQQWERIQLH